MSDPRTLSSDEHVRLLLRPKDAARALAISERSLWAASRAGQIPTVRFGRSVRYDIRDLIAVIDGLKGKRP